MRQKRSQNQCQLTSFEVQKAKDQSIPDQIDYAAHLARILRETLLFQYSKRPGHLM
jgi:hypothetical protein